MRAPWTWDGQPPRWAAIEHEILSHSDLVVRYWVAARGYAWAHATATLFPLYSQPWYAWADNCKRLASIRDGLERAIRSR